MNASCLSGVAGEITSNAGSVDEAKRLEDTHPDKVEAVLKHLQLMRPWSGPLPARDKLEKLGRYLSGRQIPFTLLLTLILLVAIGGWMLMPSMASTFSAIGMLVYLALTLLAIASALLGPIQDGIRMLKFREEAHRRAVVERQHDLFHVAELHVYAPETLSLAESVLKLQQERLTRRVTAFIGGLESLALFGLIGLGWNTWEKLGTGAPGWQDSALVYPVSFLGGITIGAVLLKRVGTRMSYHLELLALAKLYMHQRGRLAQLHTVQPAPKLRLRPYIRWVFSVRE